MPAQESTESADKRRGRPLATLLFWGGVGLAPLAALLLLVARGNGTLRVAAVLAVAAVVLIGLSITLRGDADTARLEMEEVLLEEIDQLRADLRNDIAGAARATHESFGEKLQILQNNVESLRGQLDVARTATGAGVSPSVAPRSAAPRSAAPRFAAPGFTAPVPVAAASVASVSAVPSGSASGPSGSARVGSVPAGTARVGHEPPRDDARRAPGGRVPAPRRSVDDEPPGYPQNGHDQGSYDQGGHDQGGHDQNGYDRSGYDEGGHDQGRHDQGRYDRDGYQPPGPRSGGHQRGGPEAGGYPETGGYGPGWQGLPGGGHRQEPRSPGPVPTSRSGMPAGGGGPRPPAGVVRHTETVKVTTRHTIVAPHDEGGSGNRYGPGNVYGTGNVYGGGAGYDGGDRPQDTGTHGGGGHADDGYPVAGYDGRRTDDRSRSSGWSRNDERSRDERSRDEGWTRGDRPGSDDWSRGDDLAPAADRSWNAGRTHPDDWSGDAASAVRDGAGDRRYSAERGTGDPGGDGQWAGVRTGDRWASVRSDERGHEVRVGERQAAIRSDSAGSELHLEDRWASVRQEESRRDGPGGDGASRPGGQRAPGGYWSERAGQAWQEPAAAVSAAESAGEPAGEPAGQPSREPGRRHLTSVPALPVGGVELPDRWAEDRSEPEPVRGRRHRDEPEYGFPPADDVPRAGGTRRAEYDRAEYDRTGYDRAEYDRAEYDRAEYDQAEYDRAEYDRANESWR